MAKDHRYAADALHAALKGKLPGASQGETQDREALEELEYAGELMVVQFFSLIRTFLTSKPKGS